VLDFVLIFEKVDCWITLGTPSKMS
jgi:hypothetical protein